MQALIQWQRQQAEASSDKSGGNGRTLFPTRNNEQQLYTIGFRRIVGEPRRLMCQPAVFCPFSFAFVCIPVHLSLEQQL